MLEMAEAYASLKMKLLSKDASISDLETEIEELEQKIASDYVLKEDVKNCIYFGPTFASISRDENREKLIKLLGVEDGD
jgi:hypothetical protein